MVKEGRTCTTNRSLFVMESREYHTGVRVEGQEGVSS